MLIHIFRLHAGGMTLVFSSHHFSVNQASRLVRRIAQNNAARQPPVFIV